MPVSPLPFAVPAHSTAVLLDVGNVLVDDFWETMFLTPRRGLADRLGVNHAAAQAAGGRLWSQFCYTVRDEADYWSALEDALGLVISASVRADVISLPAANPRAPAILSGLRARGLRVGVISNNTAFWYPRQVLLLDLAAYVDPEIVFCSHTHGATKSETPSLFESSSAILDPSTTLVVDDRVGNVTAARRHGYDTVHYAWKTQSEHD